MSSANDIYIVIEDARKRKWFGSDASKKQQGAGAIKVICGFWEEWSSRVCDNAKIHIDFIHPIKKGTKLNANDFKRLTNWQKSTNEHTRDAGVIAFTYNQALPST